MFDGILDCTLLLVNRHFFISLALNKILHKIVKLCRKLHSMGLKLIASHVRDHAKLPVSESFMLGGIGGARRCPRLGHPIGLHFKGELDVAQFATDPAASSQSGDRHETNGKSGFSDARGDRNVYWVMLCVLRFAP